RNSSHELQDAISSLAEAGLKYDSGAAEHIRAVCILGYLGSQRLVEHLEGRLDAAGELQNYENHALIAVGTESAAKLFERAAYTAARMMKESGGEVGRSTWSRAFHSICPNSADLRYLLTQPFETRIERWLVSGTNVIDEDLSKEL